jgi:hypothetical protein
MAKIYLAEERECLVQRSSVPLSDDCVDNLEISWRDWIGGEEGSLGVARASTHHLDLGVGPVEEFVALLQKRR